MTETGHPLHSLLQHTAFVQRIASQLAGPDADDLAQQTWAAALRSPPRQQTNLRGFLATVTNNLWRNHKRGEYRRRTREQLAAAPEELPGVDEIAAREEVRQRVVQAVLQLPAGLREVVLLRFYEGLD